MSSNIQYKYFYKTVANLLKKYKRDDILFRTNSSLGHPNKEIESIHLTESKLSKTDKLALEVMINFMGIQCSTSQLPSYILEKLALSDDGGDGWSLLFDFFNNYITWIFYDVVSMNNYAKSFNNNLDDNISSILLSFLGIKNKEIAKTYLPFAPLIANLRRPKKQVERILQTTFNLKDRLTIIENLPHHIPIISSQQNYLGIKNCQLGKNFMTGKSVCSYQTKIGILIDNLEYDEALNFFPTGSKFKTLKNSISFLTNNEFAIDLYLKIKYKPKMALKLGKNGVRLGWGSTLGKSQNSSYIMQIPLSE